jgi:hypothetical protein
VHEHEANEHTVGEGAAHPAGLGTHLASRNIDPVKRLVLAAVLVAVGALVALVTFPVSVVAATAGLATMGAGIGFGLSPAQPLLRRQLARFTKGGKAEDPS